ncbi:hypothetical protein MPLSOD_100213 [Mesorhizobium sp. SOD10]|nr:hypothetical protein MPLSOD_100213 [Mesorhizobium sp. SOD10]
MPHIPSPTGNYSIPVATIEDWVNYLIISET